MQCPYCGEDSRVLDSRPSRDEVRRRRECLDCGRRFTTYERNAPLEIRVTKRGGRPPEDFDHAKLLRAVERVARGRPVSRRACEDLVRGLEAELYDRGVHAVSTGRLAARLLEKLRELDPLAAARFASNYTDDDGALRLDDALAEEPAAEQLALWGPTSAEAPPAARADPSAAPGARGRARPKRSPGRAR